MKFQFHFTKLVNMSYLRNVVAECSHLAPRRAINVQDQCTMAYAG